jgi:hypothetical protein
MRKPWNGLVKMVGFPAIFSHCAQGDFRRGFSSLLRSPAASRLWCRPLSKRFTVAAKIPLVTTGIIGDVQASPIPPGGSKV